MTDARRCGRGPRGEASDGARAEAGSPPFSGTIARPCPGPASGGRSAPRGPIAQRSEPPAHNRLDPGSNPGGPTAPRFARRVGPPAFRLGGSASGSPPSSNPGGPWLPLVRQHLGGLAFGRSLRTALGSVTRHQRQATHAHTRRDVARRRPATQARGDDATRSGYRPNRIPAFPASRHRGVPLLFDHCLQGRGSIGESVLGTFALDLKLFLGELAVHVHVEDAVTNPANHLTYKRGTAPCTCRSVELAAPHPPDSPCRPAIHPSPRSPGG